MADSLFESDATGGVELAGYAHVALERGVDAAAAGLTYGIPKPLGDLSVGERVVVPLGRGNKPVTGYVVELPTEVAVPKSKLKLVLKRAPGNVSLPSELVDLARWIASYYCCPLGMVFTTMLPAAVKRGTGLAEQKWVALAEPGDEDAGDDPSDAEAGAKSKPVKTSKLQKAVLEASAEQAAEGKVWLPMKDLADLAGARSVSPVQQLIDKGLLRTKVQLGMRVGLDDLQPLEAASRAADADRQLTPDQQKAVAAIEKAVHDGFGVTVLHGVTGSGKTEVYLRAIQQVVNADQANESHTAENDADETSSSETAPPGVIVLVPEISLTPQTMAWFMGRFDRVAVLHSGLTAAQRHEQWRRIRAGEANIVIGARSAVFAPIANLRLIIVDEEHESSYKQDQLPRYHARDVAIKRAQQLNIPVVLGSATPSLESYFNATGMAATEHLPAKPPRKNYQLIELPTRVAGLKLPKVHIVDLIEERRARKGIHLISRQLEDLLKTAVSQGGQGMLLLNRRGYANYVACPDHNCGWMLSCDHCDTLMVYHKDKQLPQGGLVRCHHCGAEQLLKKNCPSCAKKITAFGLGVQRVEEEVQQKLPGVRLLRMDSDTMRRFSDYHKALEQFRQGELDLLVGTQMIAKGLDFPNVRVVGIVSGDTSLNMPDFRAAERTFQLIAQVSGRAGRGEQPGTAVVQSFAADDPVIELASKHDYGGFAQREIALRAEVGLPPIGRIARIVVRDRDHLAAYERATKMAQHLRQANEHLQLPVQVRGPMACAIARIADFHRQQIELLAPGPGSIQKLMTTLRNARLLQSDAATAVDVDPVSLL